MPLRNSPESAGRSAGKDAGKEGRAGKRFDLMYKTEKSRVMNRNWPLRLHRVAAILDRTIRVALRGIQVSGQRSTPNMTGRRLHRTMAMIPSSPRSLKALLFPTLLNKVQTRECKGCKRGTTRNFLHSSGVFQRPLTLILLQKYRHTNGSRVVIQIGGVYTTFCQEEGILLHKYRDRNGRCIAMFFKCIEVRGQCGSPEFISAPLSSSHIVHGRWCARAP